MEAVEDRKCSAASRRAIEIVMVMNSQPTLHDRKSMLYWGTLLQPIMEKYSSRNGIPRRCNAADVHFCTYRNWETIGWFTPMRSRKIRHNLHHPDDGAGHG
jgi:hypothetical protein